MNITLSDAIILGLITAVVNVTIALIQNKTKGVERERKEATRDQYIDDVIDRFDDRLDVLEKKVDTHNHYAEKFGDINKSVAEIRKDIASVEKDASRQQKDIELLRKEFSNVCCIKKEKN